MFHKLKERVLVEPSGQSNEDPLTKVTHLVPKSLPIDIVTNA